MSDDSKKHQCESSGEKSVSWIVKWIGIIVFSVGGAYYLWMQHRAHVLQFLPFAFFLLCPLMHLFPGGCHGGHKNHGESKEGGHHHA